MSRFLFAIAVLFLAMPAFSAEPATAQAPAKGGKGAAYPYPARAPIVVSLNGYEQARERLTKLLTTALPKEAPKLTKRFDDELAKVLKGRKLNAIRKDARLFVVVNDLANLFGEDHLPVAVLVPVTTYKEFRESFLTRDELKTFDAGRDNVDAIKTEAFGDEITIHMVDLKEYVAITPDKATADTYAGKYNLRHQRADGTGTGGGVRQVGRGGGRQHGRHQRSVRRPDQGLPWTDRLRHPAGGPAGSTSWSLAETDGRFQSLAQGGLPGDRGLPCDPGHSRVPGRRGRAQAPGTLRREYAELTLAFHGNGRSPSPIWPAFRPTWDFMAESISAGRSPK